jgi:hypothetical protein
MRIPLNGSSLINSEENEMKFLTSIGASALLALTFLTGCGGGGKTLIVPDPSATIGLPTPAAAGPVNTYIGTQTPGEWSFTLDNTNDVFSYQPVTYPATATTGTTTTANGFTVLTSGSTAAGLALEVEGRAAILRLGGSTTAPIFGVPQTECYPITGRLTFQYLGSIGVYGPGGGELPYGSIVASTDTTGASWAFEDLEGNYGTGPASFSASCSTSSNLSTINFDGTSFTGAETLLDDLGFSYSVPSAEIQSNIWIGPTGFFVADQSVPIGTTLPGSGGIITSGPYGSSVVGVAEPSSALTTSDIASTSKSYLGFIYEPGNTGYSIPTSTVPVSFTGHASTGLSGEEYLNNDVTQALDPTTAMSISLGKQDSTYNGRYTSVSITVLDPNQGCTTAGKGTAGVNADGYITCTFSGTAMVGNPGGKYAIFINAINYATTKYAVPPQAMNIYLFQQ